MIMDVLKLKAMRLYQVAFDFLNYLFKSKPITTNSKTYKKEMVDYFHKLNANKVIMGALLAWAATFWILRRRLASLYRIIRGFFRQLAQNIKETLRWPRGAPVVNQILDPQTGSSEHEEKFVENTKIKRKQHVVRRPVSGQLKSPTGVQEGDLDQKQIGEVKKPIKRKPINKMKVPPTATNLKALEPVDYVSTDCWADAPPLNREYGVYSGLAELDEKSVMISKPKLVFSNENLCNKKKTNKNNQETPDIQDDAEKAAVSEEVSEEPPKRSAPKCVFSDGKLKAKNVRCVSKCAAVGQKDRKAEEASDNKNACKNNLESKEQMENSLELLLKSPVLKTQGNLNINLEINQKEAEKLIVPFGHVNLSDSLINQVSVATNLADVLNNNVSNGSAERQQSQNCIAIICLKEGLSLTLSSNKSNDNLDLKRTVNAHQAQTPAEGSTERRMVTTDTQTSATNLQQSKSIEAFIKASVEDALRKALVNLESQKNAANQKVDAFANTDNLSVEFIPTAKETQNHDDSASQSKDVAEKKTNSEDNIKVLYTGAKINQIESTQLLVDGQLNSVANLDPCGSKTTINEKQPAPKTVSNQSLKELNAITKIEDNNQINQINQINAPKEAEKPQSEFLTGKQIKAKLEQCHLNITRNPDDVVSPTPKPKSSIVSTPNEQAKTKHECINPNVAESSPPTPRIQRKMSKVIEAEPSSTYLTGKQIKAKLECCHLDLVRSPRENNNACAEETKDSVVRESTTTKTPTPPAASNTALTAQQIKAKYQNGSIGLYGCFTGKEPNSNGVDSYRSAASLRRSKIGNAASNQRPTAHISQVAESITSQNEAQRTAKELRTKMLNGSLNIFNTESGCGDARTNNIKHNESSKIIKPAVVPEAKQELTAKQIKARNLFSSIN